MTKFRWDEPVAIDFGALPHGELIKRRGLLIAR